MIHVNQVFYENNRDRRNIIYWQVTRTYTQAYLYMYRYIYQFYLNNICFI